MVEMRSSARDDVETKLPRIGVVGAGKVGMVLATALQRTGFPIAAVWDRMPAAQARVEREFGRAASASTPEELAYAADFVIVAVPDDALADLVLHLAAAQVSWAGTAVVHVSGRYGANVLRPLADVGATTAAMHPAMAFTGDIDTEVERVRGAGFAVTGSSGGISAAKAVVEQLRGRAIEIAESDRIVYHAALAHSSNHLVTLIAQAARMLEEVGVAEPTAVLGPAVRAALDNALQLGAAATTGPVVRGDVGTVEAHVAALSRVVPGSLTTYRTLSLATADIAIGDGRLAHEVYERLERALTSGG